MLTDKQQMIEEMEQSIASENQEETNTDNEDDEQNNHELEISAKLETRVDYIDQIKQLCDKRGVKPPKALARKKLSDLKEILAEQINDATNQAFHLGSQQNEQERQNEAFLEDRAVNTLYRMDMILLTVVSNMSEKYKTMFNGKYIDNAQKRFEESKDRREELKNALRALYQEEGVKEFIDEYCNPVVQVVLINMGALAVSITDGQQTLQQKVDEKMKEELLI